LPKIKTVSVDSHDHGQVTYFMSMLCEALQRNEWTAWGSKAATGSRHPQQSQLSATGCACIMLVCITFIELHCPAL